MVSVWFIFFKLCFQFPSLKWMRYTDALTFQTVALITVSVEAIITHDAVDMSVFAQIQDNMMMQIPTVSV